jgi:hypothetical protein
MHVLNGTSRESFVTLEVTRSEHNEFISLHFFLFVNLNIKWRRMEKFANISAEQVSYVQTYQTINSLSWFKLEYFSADKFHNLIQYLLCEGRGIAQTIRHWLLTAETRIRVRVNFSEVRGGWNDAEAGSFSGFFCFPLIIFILLMFHAHISPPYEIRNYPYQTSTIPWSSESSGMYCRVLNWMSTDVSEVHAAFIIRAPWNLTR